MKSILLVSLFSLVATGCLQKTRDVSAVTDTTASQQPERPYFGRMNDANHTYPGGCGEVYETNVRNTGCDVTYRILRPSYNYNGTRCTDLIVVSRNSGCRAGYTIPEAPGATIRKCQDGSSRSYGGARNIVNYLLGNARGLQEARQQCQASLRQSQIAFEKFDAVYEQYQERLNNVGRDLLINSLEAIAGHVLDNEAFDQGMKTVINTAISQITDRLREGGQGEVSVEQIAEDQTKATIIEAVKDFIKRNLPSGTPDILIDALASMTVEETLDQARKAAQGESTDAMEVLGSLADQGADMLIGAVSSIGDKFGLGGVLATELQLLKAQISVLASSIPYFVQNAETSRICDNYVSLFNTSGAHYAAQVQQCVRRARGDNPSLDRIMTDAGL